MSVKGRRRLQVAKGKTTNDRGGKPLSEGSLVSKKNPEGLDIRPALVREKKKKKKKKKKKGGARKNGVGGEVEKPQEVRTQIDTEKTRVLIGG